MKQFLNSRELKRQHYHLFMNIQNQCLFFLIKKEDEPIFLKIFFSVFLEVHIDPPAYHREILQAHNISKLEQNTDNN